MDGGKQGLRAYTLGAVLLGLLLVGVASNAGAWATITVNSLADPGKPGICALRDAITAANTMTATNGCTAGKGHDTIKFSVTGTIRLADTLPEITDSQLTINGPVSPGITISGGGKVQVMQVAPDITLNVNKLKIANGFISNNSGGGIVNQGTLTLTDSTFSGNSTGNLGGGIFNLGGTLTVINSTFSRNSGSVGAGIYNGSGTLTVTNSTFTGNSGSQGIGTVGTATIIASTFSGNTEGAIDNCCGTLTVTNSTFSGNSTAGDSGGISNGGTLIVTNSTFSGNSGSAGAGIFNGSRGLGTVINTTFSGNNASVRGGGIFNFNTITVTNSTFAGNSAGEGGGVVSFGGGMTIKSTIMAANGGGNCLSGFGPIIDAGYNISDDDSCGFTAIGSLNNTDPQLDPAGLANNGGPTQTIALLSGVRRLMQSRSPRAPTKTTILSLLTNVDFPGRTP
jgi:hypothetical protein